MKFNKFLLRHLAIYFMVIASFYNSLTGVFVKLLSAQIPAIEIVFFRHIFGLIFLLYVAKKSNFKNKGGHPFMLAFRGLIGVFGIMIFFYNIAHISMAEAYTFQKTAPIFIALIAFFFLKEKLNSLSWFALFLGFIGILLIIQPHVEFSIYDIYGLATGICAAMALTSVRELKKYYNGTTIILSVMVCGTFGALACMILAEFYTNENFEFLLSTFKFPDLKGWIFIFLLGGAGLMYQIYVTKAYLATKKAGIVATVSYADILFSTFFGLILGDIIPNFIAFIGMALIIISGAIVANRK